MDQRLEYAYDPTPPKICDHCGCGVDKAKETWYSEVPFEDGTKGKLCAPCHEKWLES